MKFVFSLRQNENYILCSEVEVEHWWTMIICVNTQFGENKELAPKSKENGCVADSSRTRNFLLYQPKAARNIHKKSIKSACWEYDITHNELFSPHKNMPYKCSANFWGGLQKNEIKCDFSLVILTHKIIACFYKKIKNCFYNM